MLGKRRIQYEDELANDSRNYDVWFDYARLEEGALRRCVKKATEIVQTKRPPSLGCVRCMNAQLPKFLPET